MNNTLENLFIKPILPLWALVAALSVIWSYDRMEISKREAVPASDFFEVKRLSIPNFVEGENPVISYDRLVKKAYTVTWNIAFYLVGGENGENQAACVGTGIVSHTPDEKSLAIGMKLNQFVGKDCQLVSGQWILKANWELHAEGYAPKFQSANSNVFTVSPKGSLLSVTPDQAIKLNEKKVNK